MEQSQINRPAGDTPATGATMASSTTQSQVPLGLDDLLDEIEDLVAQDAQSFVQGFVQEGGE
ncbi:MAG: ubiquitin-like protein Pup [Mobiluncus sp.]|nr:MULTISPECIES: ubiquitin-like protein Pup [Mobiluncus]MCI6584377.1 ubiquitin-like protein Pup [Mobiluncus sp.]